MPYKDNTKYAQCQTTMTTVIYVLCGVSIALSAISIFINYLKLLMAAIFTVALVSNNMLSKRRRQNGRGKKKD